MASTDEDGLFKEVGDYLLATQSWHDCHFLVGSSKERIGALKSNLINQSRIWWSMLAPESSLVEKGDISLPDIEADIFRLLLKHSYGGLDDCSILSAETMMKLCYCGNKYLMPSLMKKISVRLQPCSVDQLFPALHCLVYYNLQGVEDAVKKIVQNQTDQIFEHPEFLECDIDSVTYIAKQDTLKCGEIGLWKALVTWAKHKARSTEGPKLREWMLHPLKHIRLLLFDMSELFEEVFSKEILISKEIAHICLKNVTGIETLCNEKDMRGQSTELTTNKELVVFIEQNIKSQNDHCSQSYVSCSCITVKSKIIVLQSITVRGILNGCCNVSERCKEYYFGKKVRLI